MTDPRPRPWVLLGGFAVIALGVACSPARVRTDSGVAVGNPGNLRLALAPGEDVEFDSARIEVSTISLVDCAGKWEVVAQDTEVPLDPSQPLLIPARRWCGLVLEDVWLTASVVVAEEGSEPDALDVGTLELWGDKGPVPGSDLALWLGSPGWVDDDRIMAWTHPDGDGEDLEALVEDLAYDSVLVVDTDSDGPDVEDPELAWGEPELDPLDSEDDASAANKGRVVRESGCGTETETVEGLALFALALGGFGRRRRRHD